MNYYFLLEDEKSFIKVLPDWLRYMGFLNTRVPDIKEVTADCYIMQSGQGVTQLITRVLYQTIDTIADNPGVIDELVILLDSEQYNLSYRKEQVENIIEKYVVQKGLKKSFSYKVFVCNHCFETWLLGNRKMYPLKCPKSEEEFFKYYVHYDVSRDDPENMEVPEGVNETIASYHFHYLHEMCRYKKIRYSKKNPKNMATKEYFNEMVGRVRETSHLGSFREFYLYFANNRK